MKSKLGQSGGRGGRMISRAAAQLWNPRSIGFFRRRFPARDPPPEAGPLFAAGK